MQRTCIYLEHNISGNGKPNFAGRHLLDRHLFVQHGGATPTDPSGNSPLFFRAWGRNTVFILAHQGPENPEEHFLEGKTTFTMRHVVMHLGGF